MTGPIVALIAAVARNGVIGRDNGLVWRLPSDLKRFKALTLGRPLIMGRKTFQSIGRPLPGRETIVVTRQSQFRAEGVLSAPDLDAAFALAARRAAALGANEIMVAGGGDIYAQTISRADRLFLTEVALAPDGDVRFPAIEMARWRETRREAGLRTDRDEADYTFVDYERRGLEDGEGGRAGRSEQPDGR